MGYLKIVGAVAVFFSTAAMAQVYVSPHVDRNGNYTQGHYRSNPDGNPHNNYSTRGNVKPYTGQAGRVDPYATPSYGNSRGSSGVPQQQYNPYQQQRSYRGY